MAHLKNKESRSINHARLLTLPSYLWLLGYQQDQREDGDRKSEVHDDRGRQRRGLHAFDDEVLSAERDE